MLDLNLLIEKFNFPGKIALQQILNITKRFLKTPKHLD